MQSLPDIAALMKIAQSPAGQKLLAILQASNSNDMNRIAATAAAGNLEDAKQQISRLLSSREAQELLKQLENTL